MNNNPNSQDHDPIENALFWGRFICSLADKEAQSIFHYEHGARNFPVAFSIAIWVKIGLALYFLPTFFPSEFGDIGLWYYATAYALIFNLHRIYRLTRKEEDLPHSYYDGTPWLLDNLIPQVEFSRDKWPAWFPRDMEVLIKLTVEPALILATGGLIYDALGDRALGAYLIFNGLCTFVSKMHTHAREMDEKYNRLDAENQARFHQAQAEGKQLKSRGFAGSANFRKVQEAINPSQLSEEALNARIEDAELKALKPRKAQPQTPTTAANEDLAIGTKKSSSQTDTVLRTIQRFQLDEEEDNDIPDTAEGISIFSEMPKAEPPLNHSPVSPATKINSNGTAKATAKVIKPPQSKIYKERFS